MNISLCMHCIVRFALDSRWLSTSLGLAGEGPKMLNQYFNVCALHRVRCAGYATGPYDETGHLSDRDC